MALAITAALIAIILWVAFEKRRRRTTPLKGGIDRTRTLPHSEPLELYSNSFSHCSRKVRLVLAELDLRAKHHAIDLIETGAYQTVSLAYLAVNPAGLVPTLVHQGHPVYESDDILAYAQSLAGSDAQQLVPDDESLRAEMNGWLDFCAIVSANLMGDKGGRAGACIPGLTMPIFATCIRWVPLAKILPGFAYHSRIASPALFTTFKILGLRGAMRLPALRKLIHSSRDHMDKHLATLDDALSSREGAWLLGERFSLADISVGCLLLRLEETAWLDWFTQDGRFPAVAHYYERIKTRPAWSAAISAHAHPIVDRASAYLRGLARTDPALAELIYGARAGR
ncbi:MAG: glutathione S-transferase family protein [Pseudomonadota bacterium]